MVLSFLFIIIYTMYSRAWNLHNRLFGPVVYRAWFVSSVV